MMEPAALGERRKRLFAPRAYDLRECWAGLAGRWIARRYNAPLARIGPFERHVADPKRYRFARQVIERILSKWRQSADFEIRTKPLANRHDVERGEPRSHLVQGVFIVLALLWGWRIDHIVPDRADLLGAR